MLLHVVIGSLAGAIVLYIILGFTKLSHLKLLIVAVTILLNLLGLARIQTRQEATVLGSSDFILGRAGNCERLLGPKDCYQKVEYRGFPFRAIRTSYIKNKQGEIIQRHSFSSSTLYAGNPRGDGFMLNFAVYGFIASTIFYWINRKNETA